MNRLTALIFCISLGLCQCQIIDSNSTTSTVVTDPPTSPFGEVTTQTSAVADNVTVGADEAALNEVLAFGDTVVFIVAERLPSLPEDVRPAAEKILADTRDGLKDCEDTLRQNGIIWEYKVCASSYLRYALNVYAGLTKGNISSGARRPGLFFM